ncbi:Mitogen-activated protein kinase kinase kinase 10, partial [Tetrabaena socialis]
MCTCATDFGSAEAAEQQQQRQAGLVQLLAQEVEVLGRCEHPNILRLLAACLTPPRVCLVMELMETSLEHVIFDTPGKLLPLPTVLHIAVQIVQGLEYLHPFIMHRPANVLVSGAHTPRPVVKLADFGLARIRSATLPTQSHGAGTPAYVAPEAYDLENAVITHKADMFSLGTVLWVMLTGQQPWKDHSVVAVGYKVALRGERLPLGQLSSQRCPPKLRKLIQQCWEADPLRRPAAAEALKALFLAQQQ